MWNGKCGPPTKWRNNPLLCFPEPTRFSSSTDHWPIRFKTSESETTLGCAITRSAHSSKNPFLDQRTEQYNGPQYRQLGHLVPPRMIFSFCKDMWRHYHTRCCTIPELFELCSPVAFPISVSCCSVPNLCRSAVGTDNYGKCLSQYTRAISMS